VRNLLQALHRESSSLERLMFTQRIILASQIFDMVTTHSKFQAAIAQTDANPENRLKVETVLLLETCLSMTDQVRFDEEVWRSFLAAFDAGVSQTDIVLRRLLSCYQKLAPAVSFLRKDPSRKFLTDHSFLYNRTRKLFVSIK
jgi:hypothetical protein